jgi:hypothetical protein
MLALIVGLSVRASCVLALTLALAACSSPDVRRADLGEPGPGDGGSVESASTTLKWAPGTQLDIDFKWEGYAEGSTLSSAPVTIHLKDYYDPDGSKGINALIISENNLACSEAVQETIDYANKLPSYTADGVHFLQLVVFDGVTGAAADVPSALAWKTYFTASWGVGADPNFTFAEPDHNPLPTQLLVDPRTLLVYDRSSGYKQNWTSIPKLVAKNKK